MHREEPFHRRRHPRHNALMINIKKWPRVLSLSLCACTLLAVLGANAVRGGASETTVIIVRHAEKAAFPGDDPPLSETGRTRAAALRHALEKAGVAAIYATQYQRTQQTVEPLAQALKIPVSTVDAAQTQTLIARIRQKHRGETVVVSGHANTIPDILKALGAAQPAEIGESDFDNLFVVTIGESGRARLLHLRYGGRE
jgi:2,3-bisphosphoglycerate-dependent phosphoglycerate mutase